MAWVLFSSSVLALGFLLNPNSVCLLITECDLNDMKEGTGCLCLVHWLVCFCFLLSGSEEDTDASKGLQPLFSSENDRQY